MKNKVLWIGALLLAVVVFGVIYGCGQTGNNSSSSNYTIGGRIPGLTASGVSGQAATAVTDILAIGSNGEIHAADISADGTFSIKTNKGVPYALGFYNKTGTTITLLGILKQHDYDWKSLPLMNPADSSLDLGTVEVKSGSQEAIPSVNINSLLSKVNMSTTVASLYGELDNSMMVFTNVDVDGNGVFDKDEGKYYIFNSYINMGDGTGQIAKMQNSSYNTGYIPVPSSYTMVLTTKGDTKTLGSNATFVFPQAVSTEGRAPQASVTASLEATGGGEGWMVYSKISGCPIFSPEVIPAGTYTVTIDASTYTFKNYQAPGMIKINSNNNLIYPVFNLVTNEAGKIITVNYKWQKLVNGATREATAEEVKTYIEDTSLLPNTGTVYVHTSPFISFFSGPNTLIGSVIQYSRDGSSIDLSSYNIKLSDVHHVQASYNLTSRVVCKFDLY